MATTTPLDAAAVTAVTARATRRCRACVPTLPPNRDDAQASSEDATTHRGVGGDSPDRPRRETSAAAEDPARGVRGAPRAGEASRSEARPSVARGAERPARSSATTGRPPSPGNHRIPVGSAPCVTPRRARLFARRGALDRCLAPGRPGRSLISDGGSAGNVGERRSRGDRRSHGSKLSTTPFARRR